MKKARPELSAALPEIAASPVAGSTEGAALLHAEQIAALVRGNSLASLSGGLQGSEAAQLADLHTQSTTVALLKHAYDQIERAEQLINAYEKRVRQLEELAATDPLTDLMNRRGFEKFFDHEQARIRRHHSPGALFVLIDLDRFKPLNDLYGHPAGDACLQLVAQTLVKSIRIVDGAARFGGDEFALLLTQTEPERALVRVRAVAETLNSLQLEWEGHRLPIGASLGYAEVLADTTYASAYQTADHALYADKKLRKAQR